MVGLWGAVKAKLKQTPLAGVGHGKKSNRNDQAADTGRES